MTVKKRAFSFLLAMVALVTAINFAPITTVLATGGYGTSNKDTSTKYEWDNVEGTWGSSGDHTGPLTFYNDGEYSSYVATNPTSNYKDRSDEYYRTRHMTMFHDCAAQAIASNGLTTTYRNAKFTFNNQSSQLKTYYNNSGKSLEASNVKALDSNYPPNTVAANGCVVSNVNGFATFKTNSTADGSGGSDCRMIFRNFFNTDYVNYNYPANTAGNKYSTAGKEGLNISDYGYLEFDLKILDGAGYKKSRTGSPTDGFRVHFYYEPNCGTASYLDEDSWNIDGYNQNASAFNFGKQLRFDSNGNYLDLNNWVTIRIPLTDAIRHPASGKAPTVKQVTIRIVGAMNAGKEIFQIDDLRFIKNDDHEGVVYKGFGNGDYSQDMQYPAGTYFMINDFEYDGTDFNGESKRLQSGQKTPFINMGSDGKAGTSDDKVISYLPGLRREEVNTNDRLSYMSTTGNMGWADSVKKDGVNNTYCSTGPGVVTQGDYCTIMTSRNTIYNYNAEGWRPPVYYVREYTNKMDLTPYTHFSIDLYFRNFEETHPANAYKKPSGSKAQGVIFELLLYDKNSWYSSNSTLKFNYQKSYSLKFFIPYGTDVWNVPAEYTGKGWGQVVPLSTYKSPSGSNTTATGGMRFIFTRELLLDTLSTYWATVHPGQAEHCLSGIDGMRILWLNRTDGDIYNSYPDTGGGYLDVALDNFIAYTPFTSITVKNEITDSAELDTDQSFIYNLYGGYRSAGAGYLDSQLGATVLANTGYNGLNDLITAGVNTTFAVPAGGQVTITYLPFNSYYISQENFGWRYEVTNITSIGDPYMNDEKKKMLAAYVQGNNTATILPRVSLDASRTRSVSILDVMKQRNVTIVFTNSPTTHQWLDGTDTNVNTFQ